MAYTESDLLTLQAARLRGIRTVQFADRQVTYNSDAEYRALENDIRRDIAAASPTRRAKQVYGVGSNGF